MNVTVSPEFKFAINGEVAAKLGDVIALGMKTIAEAVVLDASRVPLL